VFTGPRTFNKTEKPEIKGRGGWTATPSSSSEVIAILLLRNYALFVDESNLYN